MNINTLHNPTQPIQDLQSYDSSSSEQPPLLEGGNQYSQDNSDSLEIEQPRGHLSSALCSTIINFIGSLSGKKPSTRKAEPDSAMKEMPDNVFEVSNEKVVISITDSDDKEVEAFQELEEGHAKDKEIIICEDSTERTNENKTLRFEPLSVEKNNKLNHSDDFCECLSGKHESRQECLTDRRLNELNGSDAKGQVSAFNIEDHQERNSLPNQLNSSNEVAGLFEGIKETYSEPLSLRDVRISEGQTKIQVKGTSETVREESESIKISIGIQENAGQKGLPNRRNSLTGAQNKVQQQSAKTKQEVVTPRVNPRKIEVNRSQPSRSNDQKEKSVPVRKQVVDIKSVQQAVLTRQTSVKAKTTQKETMLPPAPKKPTVRQDRSNVSIELKKEGSIVTSRSSSLVIERNSLPNMSNNSKKRKAEDAFGKNVGLKQMKKNDFQLTEAEKQKVHISPKFEPGKLLLERKTMDRVGSLPKENDPNVGTVKLGGRSCVFCAGDLEPKTSKMLSCLHRAHIKCHEFMTKKKNSQCPSCNSNSAIGDQYKHLNQVGSGSKKHDKKVVS